MSNEVTTTSNMNEVVEVGGKKFLPITPEQAFTLFRDVQLWYANAGRIPMKCGWYELYLEHPDEPERTVSDFEDVQNYLLVEDNS